MNKNLNKLSTSKCFKIVSLVVVQLTIISVSLFAQSNSINNECSGIVDAQISVSPQENPRICPGTEVTFTAYPTNAGTDPLVTWYFNGLNNPIGTGLTIKFKPTVSGVLCPQVIARDLPDNKSTYCLSPIPVTGFCPTITVELVEKPQVSLIADCINKTITALVTKPTSNVVFSFDGGSFTTSNSKLYSDAGDHTVTAKSTIGLMCMSETTNFHVDVPTDFLVKADVTTPTCDNPTGKITVTTSPTQSGVMYSFDGGATFGTSNMMVGPPAGSYTIVVKTGLGCKSNSANVVVPKVRFDGTPASITANGSMLMASNGRSWQWFLNGVAIPGATQQMYMPLTYGNITVEIINEFGCKTVSAPTTSNVDYVNNCPIIHKDFGASCDDGDPNTINDKVRNDCTCRGDLYSPNMTAKCPSNMIIMTKSPYGTVVDWQTTFTTNCKTGMENWVDVKQTSGYWSGYPFPPDSKNFIEYVASDLCGNKTSCSFYVTLTPYYGTAVVGGNLQKQTVSAFIPVVVESIYPNPAEEDVHLKVLSLNKREIGFQFFNSLGSELKTEKRTLDKGENDVVFDVSDFQDGVYYVVPQVLIGHNVPTKFVKIR